MGLAPAVDAEALWSQIRHAAWIVEILAERGNKMERCQIWDGNHWIEIIRIWRQPVVISGDLPPTNTRAITIP